MTRIPETLYELPTLADSIVASGDVPSGDYKCSTCSRIRPAAGFFDTTGLPGGLKRWACETCVSGPYREALAAQHVADRVAAGPDWSAVRARRDGLLLRSDWTQMPDNGLTDEKRQEWHAYRQLLRDVTEADHPDSVAWPDIPN